MIARQLGMTVEELYRRMSAAEMCEWIAVYNMERKAQAGPETLDQRAAALARRH